MKLNRRKLFGLVGGAAVAGPSIAREAVIKLPAGMGDLYNAVAPTADLAQSACNATFSDNGDWRLKPIADVRRLIAGDLTEDEKEDRRRRRLEDRRSLLSQHVAGLQSVSSVRKLDIYARRLGELNDEIQRSHHRGYLARLLRESAQ